MHLQMLCNGFVFDVNAPVSLVSHERLCAFLYRFLLWAGSMKEPLVEMVKKHKQKLYKECTDNVNHGKDLFSLSCVTVSVVFLS